jgi:hypothetical protein
MSNHIVLLGDSIFDNGAYTSGDPDVVTHLRGLLPPPWKATLRAVDGATTDEIKAQCPRVPSEASHLVVSMGGNDALMSSDLLATSVRSTTDALLLFGERMAQFESRYRAALGRIEALGRPTITCTIYNGRFTDDEIVPVRVALMLFNDVILRVAFEHRLAVIDLRSVCSDPADYANAIEPSGRGGRKIAEAVWRAVQVADGSPDDSRVISGV